MKPLRLPAIFLLAAALLALITWLAWPTGDAAGEAGTYGVRIVAFHGEFWNGTLTLAAQDATALGALRAASAAGGFPLDIEPTALGPYVRGIGPHHETAADGWCVFLLRDGRAESPHAAADKVLLRRGENVLWSWTSVAPGPC